MKPLIFALSFTLFGSIAFADTADVSRLVAELGSNSFVERQAAMKQLGRLGESAVELLESAAAGPNRERSDRALRLLGRFRKGGDPDARNAASDALQRLSSGTSQLAVRAKAIVDPPSADSTSVPVPRVVAAPPRVVRNKFQFQFGRNFRGTKSVTTKVANGVRDITVKENGRVVRIHDEPGKIKVAITEKNGTETFEAKDLAELRKKSAAAAKEFEKYAKPQGAVNRNLRKLGKGIFEN